MQNLVFAFHQGFNLDRESWNKFKRARDHFRKTAEELSDALPDLKSIQQKFADNRAEGNSSSYKVETPVVYNSALDDITINDEIKLILVADNPGRREQAAENRRYLVGPSGKIAKKFFLDNPELKIDFTKNVIILNKTPIHSPRTLELKDICFSESEKKPRDNRKSLSEALIESQKKMAVLLFEFHEALCCPVWITGYSQMHRRGIFDSYTEKLKELYTDKPKMYKQIFLYRHFSMNQFTIDLKQQTLSGETSKEALNRIGAAYRQKILGN